MKWMLPTLFVLLPLSALAELSVVCKPSTLYLDTNTNVKVSIYVRNDGDESVKVPTNLACPTIGCKLDGVVFEGTSFKVVPKGMSIISDGGGFVCGLETDENGNRKSSCTSLSEHAPATGLEPEETIVYEVWWRHASLCLNPTIPVDMYILTFEFVDWDIPIQPITLLPVEK